MIGETLGNYLYWLGASAPAPKARLSFAPVLAPTRTGVELRGRF